LRVLSTRYQINARLSLRLSDSFRPGTSEKFAHMRGMERGNCCNAHNVFRRVVGRRKKKRNSLHLCVEAGSWKLEARNWKLEAEN
jgi:hypothetical protein